MCVTRRASFHAGRASLLALALFSIPTLADVVVPREHHVEIRGAPAMSAVARAVAELYMSDHPDVTVTVSGGGTYRGFKSVIVGTADMAMGTEDLTDELTKLASDRHVELEEHAVFSDAVVPVVAPESPVGSLSMRQLRDIFSGRVRRWEELGVGLRPTSEGALAGPPVGKMPFRRPGADAGGDQEPDIDVVTFVGNAGPYETFKKEVLGDDFVMTPRAREIEYAALEGALGPRSIGYVGMHQVGRLKALRVDGVAATPETVRSGKYSIARRLSIFVRKPASRPTSDVLDYFLAKDKGQRIAESLGNVPVQ